MAFFDFVLRHWVLSLVVYVVLFWKTALRFADCMSRQSWYQRIYYYNEPGWNPDDGRVYPLRKVVRFLSFLVGLATGPIFLLFFPLIDRTNEKRHAQERQEQEREQEEYAKKKAEQEQRIAEWRKANPPVLCYNVMAGITAVVRKDNYERCFEETRRARINGLWTNEDVLMPIRETFLFVHASVLERVPENFRTGWFSDFEDLKEIVRAERREDIFVPLASEGLLPHDDQLTRIIDLKQRWGDDPQQRLKIARDELFWQNIPTNLLE